MWAASHLYNWMIWFATSICTPYKYETAPSSSHNWDCLFRYACQYGWSWLKDLTSKELGQAATSLLETITNLLNQIIIPGKIPGEVCEIFYGASLMALSKTCGGIRPIAIGFTFRRLAGKVLMSTLKGECSDLFHPQQLGVGTALGTEIAVHSIRQYINNPDSTCLSLLFFSY